MEYIELTNEDIAAIDAAGVLGPGGSFFRKVVKRVAATALLGTVALVACNYLGVNIL